MRSKFWTVMLILGFIVGVSLMFAGIGVCFTALELIVKYVLFMLSVGIGIVMGTICIVLLLAD